MKTSTQQRIGHPQTWFGQSLEPRFPANSRPTTFAVAASCLVAWAAVSTSAGQNCPPGQQETSWQTLSGFGLSIIGGFSCGALGQPTLQPGGNLVWPGGFAVVTGANEICIDSYAAYISRSSGCLGGGSLTMFGTFTIPAQGGTFRAAGGIVVTQTGFQCVSGNGGAAAASGSIGPITYTAPGEYSWAIHAPAYYSSEQGRPTHQIVQTQSYICLQVNGGTGLIQILSQGSRIAPTCPSDVDDGSGTGTFDGGVTIDDLLYYLRIFEEGAITADVDDGSGTGTPDGGVTIDDLLYYLVRFEAGC